MEADLIPPGGILVPPDPWKPVIVRVHNIKIKRSFKVETIAHTRSLCSSVWPHL